MPLIEAFGPCSSISSSAPTSARSGFGKGLVSTSSAGFRRRLLIPLAALSMRWSCIGDLEGRRSLPALARWDQDNLKLRAALDDFRHLSAETFLEKHGG